MPADPPKETLRQGRYAILGSLGQGAQGHTFDGVDLRQGRPVAIKRFDVRSAKAWKDAELAEREARVLQSLSHPKLPRYVEHFEEDGALFLVMEKIEGESLASLRKRGGRLAASDVTRLLRDAAEVLDYLHGRAPPVIHRDLKPGNVIRRPDGSFAFVDFGAVRDKLRPEGGSTVVGTFGFMAPEQFQGRAMPASDVYAIGATALSMLTGVEPQDLPHKGLAIDVPAALAPLGERMDTRLAGALVDMLDPDPDRRPSRIAPLLERPYAPRRAWESGLPEAGWIPTPEHYAEQAVRYAEDTARRHSRMAVRRAVRAARRQARRRGGVPWPVRLLLVLGFAVGIVAVTLATQIVVPGVLLLLSVFFGRRGLTTAARGVREAGREAVYGMNQSRRWLSSGEAAGGRVVEAEPGARVRVDASTGARGEDAHDDDDDAIEEDELTKRR